jgi:type IV pilus assembly protein PilW
MNSRSFMVAKRLKAQGLTLVELLVSLVLVSLITLATLAMYNSSSSTYRTTDANQELQDNARFIFDVFSQAVRQSGLQDSAQYASFSAQNTPTLAPSHVWDLARYGAQPALFGSNDGVVANVSTATDFGADDSGGYNNSDVFGVRYFGASKLTDKTIADGSIIDCRGVGVPYPLSQTGIGLSLFQVAIGTSGEPELQCINQGRTAQPIVSGVESLQIVYAVDTDAGAGADATPNRWLDAKQVTAAALWPKVRAVRIGMVLRAAVGSATGAPNVVALYPLGEDFSKVGGAIPAGGGITFNPPNDNRLRRAFTFNIAIRNTLEQL